MPERTGGAVTVDVTCGEGVPTEIRTADGRRRVVAVTRQWDQGQQRSYDVALDGGQTAILRHNRRSGQWTLVDVRGPARQE